MSIVVPACGPKNCLFRYLRSIFGRALGTSRCRILVVLGNSRGPCRGGVGGFLLKCRQIGGVGCFCSDGGKMSVTQGVNLSLTVNRCVYFISSSSVISRGFLSRLCGISDPSCINLYGVFDFRGRPSRVKARFFIDSCVECGGEVRGTSIMKCEHCVSCPITGLCRHSVVGDEEFSAEFAGNRSKLFSELVSSGCGKLEYASRSTICCIHVQVKSTSQSGLSLKGVLGSAVLL